MLLVEEVFIHLHQDLLVDLVALVEKAGADSSEDGNNATFATGSGGGGSNSRVGGNGGSGIVVVRYEIGSVSTTKATGGAISLWR